MRFLANRRQRRLEQTLSALANSSERDIRDSDCDEDISVALVASAYAGAETLGSFVHTCRETKTDLWREEQARDVRLDFVGALDQDPAAVEGAFRIATYAFAARFAALAAPESYRHTILRMSRVLGVRNEFEEMMARRLTQLKLDDEESTRSFAWETLRAMLSVVNGGPLKKAPVTLGHARSHWASSYAQSDKRLREADHQPK